MSESVLQFNIYPCDICKVKLISVFVGLKPIIEINPKTVEFGYVSFPSTHKTNLALPTAVLLEVKGMSTQHCILPSLPGILSSIFLSPTVNVFQTLPFILQGITKHGILGPSDMKG